MSMATGKSMPVNKSPKDEVIGATVNQEGLLNVKATKIGKDNSLSQVIKMVEECQGSKVPIRELADRITSYFVPIVLGIAGVTFISWLLFPNTLHPVTVWASLFLPWVNPGLGVITSAIFAGVAVLVIACPCALGAGNTYCPNGGKRNRCGKRDSNKAGRRNTRREQKVYK